MTYYTDLLKETVDNYEIRKKYNLLITQEEKRHDILLRHGIYTGKSVFYY